MTMLIVRLKPGKETPVTNGHPWIFSGAVDRVQGEPHRERLCRVLNARGQFVCQGMYNPASQIAVRVLTTGKEPIGKDFFRARILGAMELRRSFVGSDTTCLRLVNGEGDLLPGLVVDRYGDVLVVQVATPGMDDVKSDIVDVLREALPSCCIVERSDTRARQAEGLRAEVGPLHKGPIPGEVEVTENGIPYAVDVLTGDRTGFYLEHRLTRGRIAAYARGRTVLDVFSYTGSFSVCALKAGAVSITSVDSSAPAQVQIKRNMELNRIRPFVWRHHKEDATRFLQADRELYGLVFLDAPAAYSEYAEFRKLCRLTADRVVPGGILFVLAGVTSQFEHQDILKALQRTASSLSRKARVLEALTSPPDFPWLPSHPQGLHQAGFVVHLE